METVTIYIKLEEMQGDMGMFKQKSVILRPINILLAVKLPADPEYIYNLDDLKDILPTKDGKTGLEIGIPRLTLKGVKKLKQIIHETLTEDAVNTAQEDDWDETEDYSNDWN